MLSKAGNSMHWKEQAIRERDETESRSFLIGLANGIWMSALVTLALYWLVQGILSYSALGYDLWLDPGMTHTATAVDLLMPYDATLMNGYPVSARVNAVANDDAECSIRIDIPQP
jgi:hypothetical protein